MKGGLMDTSIIIHSDVEYNKKYNINPVGLEGR